VLVASAIAQPDVIALIGKHKSGSLVFVIDKPTIRAVEKSVLENDWLEAVSNGTSLSLDSEHGENVSILGNHLVCLGRIIVEFAIVQEF
jgi:hypothetical protein